MNNKTLALGSAAAIAFAGLLSASPALAFTHHPATPEEIQQTDALNAQALANARMGTTSNAPTANTDMNATTGATMTAPAAPDVNATTTTNGDVNATTPAPETKPAPATQPAPSGSNGY
jgi:hypothetical protein